ncbi:MAG: sodium:proton antiporter [Planctomycetota bacterium]|nr:sodium:proton antiporter [Planctomycetota bacterium]
MLSWQNRVGCLFVLVVLGLGSPSPVVAAEEATGPSMGEQMPVWTVLPFAGLLLSIAILPLTAGHWWEHNRNRAIVTAAFTIPVVIYFLVVWGTAGVYELEHKLKEYIAFIALLGSLYVVSGGIYVRGSLSGTPLVNTGFLALGGSIASIIGTTGASMLLIRPMLRANQSRQRVTHIVVFFIFVVSNCGGLLTPLGDPPLFLGFLVGVPFDWTLQLWKEWAFVNGVLLVIFHVWDEVVFNKEEVEREGSQLEEVQRHAPFGIDGKWNFLFLMGIVVTIYCSGNGYGNDGEPWPFGIQEALMFGLGGLAMATTKRENREKNRFSFEPILEVAILFIGIFVTMTPALLILNEHGASLGFSRPWHYFWGTGLLSSFLDNAPTYLTFAATAAGTYHVPVDGRYLAEFLKLPAETNASAILAAISCGAVFMGANTYIGNGPNFMVKAIAEQNGVKMPGFFGFMIYSFGVLVPILIVTTFLFFI